MEAMARDGGGVAGGLERSLLPDNGGGHHGSGL